MTLQTVAAFAYPGVNPMYSGGANPSVGSSTQINASGEFEAVVFSPTEDFTLTEIGFYVQVVTGAGTVDVSIEGLGALGVPDGTPIADNGAGTATKTSGTISATGWVQVALDNSATLNAATDYAVVIRWASGDLTIGRVPNTFVATGKPYTVVNTTGTAAKSDNKTVVALYDGTKYLRIPNYGPASSFANQSFDDGSTPDEYGVRFRLPFKARIAGLVLENNVTGAFDIYLSDDGGNALGGTTTSITPANRRGTQLPAFLSFGSSQVLDADTWYRAWIKPTSATNVLVWWATLDSAALKTAWPCGADWNFCARLDGGTPDDTNAARLPLIDLIVDQLDDGVSGGGGGGSGPLIGGRLVA